MLSRNLEKTLHRALSYANERHHEYATLEHLLLALTEDQDAIAMLRACLVDLDRLRRDVLTHIDSKLTNLVSNHSDDAKPTASFQRVLQRAAIHVQASAREEVTGANVLVAMFAEQESDAVKFLKKQEMTRFDAVNYISHGIAKAPGRVKAGSESIAHDSSVSLEILENYSTSDISNTAKTGATDEPFTRTIFISYSHRDHRWISRLEIHLKSIVESGTIEYWHDGMISPGGKWREEIRQSIEKCKIAILLVSADFLASDFISKNELPPLLKKPRNMDATYCRL